MGRRLILLAAVAVIFPGCVGSGMGSFGDAVAAWQGGRVADSLALAEAEYARYRDHNSLTEAAVSDAVDKARRQLDEVPIVPGGERLVAPDAVDPWAAGPDVVAAQVRRDLLSGRVTPVMRGIASVAALGLAGEWRALLAIVYRRPPLSADAGVLKGASTALRSVAAKRAALDALRFLALGR